MAHPLHENEFNALNIVLAVITNFKQADIELTFCVTLYSVVGTFQEKTCLRLVCARAHGILCTSSRAQELVRMDTSFCINIYDKYVFGGRWEKGKKTR